MPRARGGAWAGGPIGTSNCCHADWQEHAGEILQREPSAPRPTKFWKEAEASWRLFASTSAGWTSTRSRWWLRSSPPKAAGSRPSRPRPGRCWRGPTSKLANVAADVLGVSGRAMLEGLIEGQQGNAELAHLARGRMKSKQRQLEEALEGSFGPHQRWMLRHHLDLIDFHDAKLKELDAEVAERMRPFLAALNHLDAISGLGQQTAQEIVGEIGTDMSQFPTDRQIASWAKLSPGSNESGGKKRPGRTGKGVPIRHIMIRAALN